MNDELTVTCTSIDCPERTGGICNVTTDPELLVECFLSESNKIEGVYDEDSLKQAKYAWDYLIKQEKIDGGVILKLHKILMLHQKLLPNQRGYWRQIQVGIYKGGVLLREGPQWRLVPELIAQWIRQVNYTITSKLNNLSDDQRAEERIKEDHIAYEKIHPFVDGNGRTGRMLMNWTRLKVGLPILVIFEEDKQEYYQWFR